ncbi:AAA and adenylate/guanylate cyclase domain-containing protein [Bradyrhizobium sp. Leo170]|uniref:AAA and adenylate/guanylate cyclase domain-containing protein n=1 Tax=Bradyrhizobium sp. Leo170 TaxID=1571199 RepID=UPI00102EB316|nr:AAA and adenylate/guanylate cyclase domain-containing protein [Bradyrhizobium sp. Leo170]TAI65543.1 adenylate/guanylate cyclase [Bradyrhizobium sp. Leo170]
MLEEVAYEARLVESFTPPPLRLAASGATTAADGDRALLWLDVVGFTRITGHLVETGPAGIEQMAVVLERHFHTLLGNIVAHGGEPFMFAGDGLLSGWRCSEATPREAVLRAAACGQAILSSPGAALPSGDTLQLHAVLALGPSRTTEVGHATDRFHVTVGGGLADLQATSVRRAAGRLLLSPAARAALGDAAETVEDETGAVILAALNSAPAPVPLVIPPLSPSNREHFAPLVPLPIRSHLGQRYLDWAAELRRVTAVFIALADFDQASPDSLQQLESVAATVGPVVRRHDGFMHQLRVDESGANLFVLFGIPPVAHPDDPVRAVRCAIDLRDALRGMGRRCSLGVATGRVFCGLIGNDIFRAWTTYGEAINLAARLRSSDIIQCDHATYRAAHEAIAFDPVGLRGLRGLKPAVQVWTPQRSERAEARVPMQGRERELAELLAAIEAAGEGAARLVMVEAESGMGKSRLLAEFHQRTLASGVVLLNGYADRIERDVPYRGWRDVLARLLDVDLAASDTAQREAVLSALGPEFAAQAALLNVVFPLNLPETGDLQAVPLPQRAQLRLALLVDLLRRASAGRPLLVSIDDAHWLDEESWLLVEATIRDVRGLCLVLAMQPLEDDSRLERLADEGAQRLRLGELSDEDQERLVLARLGAERLTEELSAQVRGRARGHPFFCLELAQALRDDGLIEVVEGVCHIVPSGSMTDLPMPDSVQGTVMRRIDRLAPESQVTLKVASAAGLRFPTLLVSEVHPTARGEQMTVARHLALHDRVGFLLPDQVDEREGYAFRHGIIRDVAYESMLYAQRRQLHREIALWNEDASASNRSRVYALLAYHWEAAGETARATDYLRLEAERVFGAGLVGQSIEIGLRGARLLGSDLPTDRGALHAAIGQELETIGRLLDGRRPDELAGLPPLTDERAGQLIHLLLVLAPFAHQSEQVELFALMGCRCLRLTLEYGNGPLAPDVYSMYSVVYGALTGDRDTAAIWSRVGLALLKGERGAGFARCSFIHAWFHNHWVAPLGEGIALADAGSEAGLGDNEVIYGCFNLSASVVLLAAAGRPLAEVMEQARIRIERNGQRVLNAYYHLVFELQFAKALAGLTSALPVLGDAEFDEVRDIDSVVDTNLSNQIGYYFVTRLKLHLHACDWSGALEWAARAHPMLPYFGGQAAEFELSQYRGLAAVAAAAFGAAKEGLTHLQEGRDCLERLRGWEARNPAVFRHKADLLDGLVQAAMGRDGDAARLLGRSGEGAAAGGFLQDAGLAHEYLARCRRLVADRAGATASALAAREMFRSWGADAKVRLLEKEFELPPT